MAGSGVACGRPRFFFPQPCDSGAIRKRTRVYVDGFNVYFAIRFTPYRWLDLGRLARLLLADAEIDALRYFTARVEARDDPAQPQRQETYLRALRTIPDCTLHFGRFLQSQVRMAYVTPPLIGARTALMWKTEEKGSDVNLATYLLADGFLGRYEQAVVVSNDSDLVEPIRMVREQLGKPVIVLNPGALFSVRMRDAATAYRKISEASLKAAQFPVELMDEHGTFHRPPGWEAAKQR